MATLTIKSLPDRLYQLLKAQAARERRSINSQVIICLERALMTRRRDPAALLERIDKLRSRLKVPPLTDEFLREAKNWGRP